MRHRGNSDLVEKVEALQPFLSPWAYQRLRILAGRDPDKFWREMTSGKYLRSPDKVVDKSDCEKIITIDTGSQAYLSDEPDYPKYGVCNMSAGYNYIIVQHTRLLYSFESRYVSIVNFKV